MTRSPAPPLGFALLNAVFMVAASTVAAATLYPVWASPAFIAVAAAAISTGAAGALLCTRMGWRPLVGLGIGVGAYAAIGLALGIPSLRAGDTTPLAALASLARAPIFGWKDVVTLPLPLGEYGATLLTPLALLLAGTFLAVWLSAASRRWWGFAGAITVWMVATAVLVGPVARAEPLPWAPDGVYLTREFVVGLATFAVLLGWTLWRSSSTRRRALATARTGARLATVHRARVLGGLVMGTAMLAVALVVAALVAGPVAATTARHVARSVVEPRLVVNSTVTPLAAYRTFFTDDAYDTVLFTVNVSQGEVPRVRIATLPFFDGEAFTASAPRGRSEAPFERVPSRIAAPAMSVPVSAQIEIGEGGGVWVPLVGQLGSVTFHGDHSGALVDSFFYQPRTGTGIVTAADGLRPGDSYTVTAYVTKSPTSLDVIGAAPRGDVIDSSDLPSSLTDWVARQGVSRDGAGLADLVDRIRERGYLSHDLADPGAQSAWESALGAYEFASAPAGSSYDRIDRFFQELNARESEVADTPGASLVAAVGDDEQFAAAVALVAADLGFPSRVVLGARLTSTDSNDWIVPPCVDGVCKGQNLAAWVEVQAANGTWVPVDVTPQHTNPPSPDVTQERDPKFVSALDPKRAQPIAPPASQRGAAADSDTPVRDVTRLWDTIGPYVRIAGISLLGVLIVLAPLFAILIWKGLRRRRRRAGAPHESIHHGWDEYLDTAVEAGFDPLPLATRLETARSYRSLNGVRLAQLTDRTTFGGGTAVAQEAEEFWRLIAAERAAWMADRGLWARMRMRLSLRALWHSVAQQAPHEVPSTAPGSSQEGR